MKSTWSDKKLVKVLEENGIAVMPTDTLYGIVGRAQSISAVNCIYKLRQRNPEKPCIILIGDESELKKFSTIPSEDQKTAIKKYWPGPVSIVLDCKDDSLKYLHRGTKTLAFRMPAPQALLDLLMKTGPLIAPSANPQGLSPAQNIIEAKKYFGSSVDLYVDGGELKGKASKVVKLNKDGSVATIRP